MYATCEDTFGLIKSLPKNKCLAEFGLFNGNTFKRLLDGAVSIGNPFKHAWGFDVFKGGLPAETENIYHNPDWVLGAFDVSRDFNLATVEDAVEFVRSRVGYDNTTYVQGYFSESLTKEVAEEIGNHNISYAHIDCDIHSSSLEVLTFIFKYNLLCDGAIIRFDDYNSTPNSGGQRLAFAQITAKYKITSAQYFDNVFKLIKGG